MIYRAQLGVEDHQTTTTTSNAGAQQFAEAMNNASVSSGPRSGQPQCKPQLYHKGFAEYAVGGADVAVGAGFGAQALEHDGPIAAAMAAAPWVVPGLIELGSGTVDVAQSGCTHPQPPTFSTKPQYASTD